MKLGHTVKYHNVFLDLHNGPYCTMPSGVIALCSWCSVFDVVTSLNRVIWIRTSWSLITMLIPKRLSSYKMVYITSLLQELLPFVHEILLILWCRNSNSSNLKWNFIKLGHNVLLNLQNISYHHMVARVIALCSLKCHFWLCLWEYMYAILVQRGHPCPLQWRI